MLNLFMFYYPFTALLHHTSSSNNSSNAYSFSVNGMSNEISLGHISVSDMIIDSGANCNMIN